MVNAAAFSPDGSQLATASTDGTARVWWIERQEPRLLGRHGGEVESIGFSASGTRVVTASRDSTARVWDVTGSTPPVRLKHDDWVRGAAFNPTDDLQVATGSFDQRTCESGICARDNRAVSISEFPRSFPRQIHHGRVWSRDGKSLGAASVDATARIWRVGASAELGDPVTLDHQLSCP